VKGRPDKRHAMAVVLGMDGRPAPHVSEFDISDADRTKAREIAKALEERLNEEGPLDDRVKLAALAELFFQYMSAPTTTKEETAPKKEAAL